MRIVAVIPARGGSKGVPYKNIKSVGGLPLIAHSILFAKKSKSIERVIVSTDDKKISDIAEAYGAEVVSRPEELSQDSSSVEGCLKHVVEALNYNESFGVVVLQPTSPVRKDETLNSMLEIFKVNQRTTITITEKTNSRLGKITANAYSPINYVMGKGRQEIESIYQESGNIYIMHSELIRLNKCFSQDVNYHIISQRESVDIDTHFDLELANLILNEKRN
tara:strand:- start:4547 stop:5209 length:663 start_codon:yes stop_codon:yes gene_type:complete